MHDQQALRSVYAVWKMSKPKLGALSFIKKVLETQSQSIQRCYQNKQKKSTLVSKRTQSSMLLEGVDVCTKLALFLLASLMWWGPSIC
jgi:hypothetical protein